MTNLVSLDLLNQRGVHWNSEYPTKLVRDGSDFLNLQQVDRHWVIQTTTYGSFATNSKLAPQAQVTAEQMHRNLAHASPEVIAHVQKASRDTVVDGTIPAPNTIQCETCSVSKATEQISRSTETEDITNGLPFDRYGWDMGELTTAYNGDRYYSHLHCTMCGFIMINTHATKPEALKHIEYNINFIRNVFGYTVRFLRLDGETSLQRAFDDFVRNIGIKPERSAPDT